MCAGASLCAHAYLSAVELCYCPEAEPVAVRTSDLPCKKASGRLAVHPGYSNSFVSKQQLEDITSELKRYKSFTAGSY